MDAHANEVEGRRVLELGAGAGLPSIMACQLGARRVVCTDYPDRELIENIEKNIVKLLSSEQQTRIQAKGFLWGSSVSELFSASGAGEEDGLFDMVFLCDVIFNHSEHRRLLKTCREVLAADGVVWCVFGHYRPAKWQDDLNLFTLAQDELGWNVEKVAERLYDHFVLPPLADPSGDLDRQRTAFAYKLTRKL